MTIVQPLELLEVPGPDGETFRLVAIGDGRAVLAVARSHGYAPLTVTVEREWVRPLAAWLAGESDPLETPAGQSVLRLSIASDYEARVFDLRAWALLTCERPFGTASVVITRTGEQPRDGYAARVTADGREQAAAWLRDLSIHPDSGL